MACMGWDRLDRLTLSLGRKTLESAVQRLDREVMVVALPRALTHQVARPTLVPLCGQRGDDRPETPEANTYEQRHRRGSFTRAPEYADQYRGAQGDTASSGRRSNPERQSALRRRPEFAQDPSQRIG